MNYKLIYDNLIQRGRNRILEGYVERHHIVPRCMGGSDDIKNLVELTPEEHYLAHLLLIKIYPNVPKLVNAVHRMSYDKKRKLPNGKMYGWVRRKYSVILSEKMKISQAGIHNSQYGTCWLSDIHNKKSFKINKKDLKIYLELGFIKGRNIWVKQKSEEQNKIRKQKRKEKEYQKKLNNAYYWYNKLVSSDSNSIREFVRNSDYNKSHVAFVSMLKKYVKEFNTQHGKPFRGEPNW